MLLFEQSNMNSLETCEQKEIARTLEFCSTNNEGINLLFQYKSSIFSILSQFFQPNIDEKSVLYASATVLLDLTANENCIEQVAQLMQEHSMFNFVVAKLHELLERQPKDSQYQKLRDLFIGIVLNLTCNVENSQIILHMVTSANIINSLKTILTDSRHDWPTNGAALALLQYCHLSLQETEIFRYIE